MNLSASIKTPKTIKGKINIINDIILFKKKIIF